MAITQLLFGAGNFLGDVEFDVVVSEGASASARLTKNPVENGADMNDHIIIDPMTYTVTGVATDTRSNILDSPSAAFGQRKSEAIWGELLQLMIDKTPFTLVQGLKSYDNVVLTSLSESQDKDTSNGLFFTAGLSEVILVGTGAPPTTTFSDKDTSDSMVPATDGGLKTV